LSHPKNAVAPSLVSESFLARKLPKKYFNFIK
jgi:hypothetical protein